MNIEIKDRVAVGDNKYTMRTLSDGRVELTPSPDSVQEPGTPLNKALLQPIVDSVQNVVAKLSDYIVEQGTSATWTYRKWNSGIAEFWGQVKTTTSREYSATEAIGVTVEYPFTFTDTPKVFLAHATLDDLFCRLVNSTPSKVALKFLAIVDKGLTVSSGTTFTTFYNVKGRWK